MNLPNIATRRFVLGQIASNFRARRSALPPIWTTRELIRMLVRGS